jgi:hypothetical protein
MDPIKNPFSPGAGSPPPELVGRDPILEEARILLGRVKAKGAKGDSVDSISREANSLPKRVGFRLAWPLGSSASPAVHANNPKTPHPGPIPEMGRGRRKPKTPHRYHSPRPSGKPLRLSSSLTKRI